MQIISLVFMGQAPDLVFFPQEPDGRKMREICRMQQVRRSLERGRANQNQLAFSKLAADQRVVASAAKADGTIVIFLDKVDVAIFERYIECDARVRFGKTSEHRRKDRLSEKAWNGKPNGSFDSARSCQHRALDLVRPVQNISRFCSELGAIPSQVHSTRPTLDEQRFNRILKLIEALCDGRFLQAEMARSGG